MAKQLVNSTSSDVGSACADEKSPAQRDLDFENARLQRLLEIADQAAAQYTVMLREGDHRIKNSLQIVASLMGLQARREPNDMAREALRAAAARIQSIARIHDALQESGGRDLVDLGEVLRKMCESLHAMAGDPLKVTVFVSVEQMRTPAALAHPIVLAVNELVINALRHGFPGERTGVIQVNVRQANGQVYVVVTDDGTGLPPDYAEGGGYGLKLVRMMTKQIGGVLHIEGSPGSRFTLVAPAHARFEGVQESSLQLA